MWGASVLLEGLSLDGGVGSTNLGVHLEVNHRGWYQGGGGCCHPPWAGESVPR